MNFGLDFGPEDRLTCTMLLAFVTGPWETF